MQGLWVKQIIFNGGPELGCEAWYDRLSEELQTTIGQGARDAQSNCCRTTTIFSRRLILAIDMGMFTQVNQDDERITGYILKYGDDADELYKWSR